MALLVSALATTPASAHSKQSAEVTFVVKADTAAAAKEAAGDVDGRYLGVLNRSRDLYSISVRLEFSEGDLNDEADDMGRKLSDHRQVLWAVANGETVADTRFFAWQTGDLSEGGNPFDLDGFLDLEMAHRMATGKG